MQAQDIINLSAKDLKVLASGESLNPEEYVDALVKLGFLLQSMDVERLNIFCVNRAQYTLTTNVGAYTCGSGGGALVPTRPLSIRAATIIVSGISTPMRILEPEEYAAYQTKGDTSIVPKLLYYDNDYPTANLYVMPLPNGTPVLELYTWEPMPAFPLLTTTFDMPPGYGKAIEYLLALDMADMFGSNVAAGTVAQIASDAKRLLEKLNLPPSAGTAQEGEARAAAQALATPQMPQQPGQPQQQ